MAKTKTTLAVDAMLWRSFRAACIHRGLTASGIFEECMQETLKKWGVEVEKPSSQKKGGTPKK